VLRTVEPHDLRGVCESFGLTLELLCDRTGIPVDELIAFSRCEIPLKATDRFAILNELAASSPEVQDEPHVEATQALAVLMGDVDQEDREENGD
jgi:hypothetical protein